MLQLSEQAKWYLRGKWPIFVDDKKIEPKAMQELIDADIVILVQGSKVFKARFGLTSYGMKRRKDFLSAST